MHPSQHQAPPGRWGQVSHRLQPGRQLSALTRSSPFQLLPSAGCGERKGEMGGRESGGEGVGSVEDPGTLYGPPLCLPSARLSPPPAPLFILRQSGWEVGGGRWEPAKKREVRRDPPTLPCPHPQVAKEAPGDLSLQVAPTLRRGGARPGGQSPPCSCLGSQPSPVQPWLCR